MRVKGGGGGEEEMQNKREGERVKESDEELTYTQEKCQSSPD